MQIFYSQIFYLSLVTFFIPSVFTLPFFSWRSNSKDAEIIQFGTYSFLTNEPVVDTKSVNESNFEYDNSKEIEIEAVRNLANFEKRDSSDLESLLKRSFFTDENQNWLYSSLKNANPFYNEVNDSGNEEEKIVKGDVLGDVDSKRIASKYRTVDLMGFAAVPNESSKLQLLFLKVLSAFNFDFTVNEINRMKYRTALLFGDKIEKRTPSLLLNSSIPVNEKFFSSIPSLENVDIAPKKGSSSENNTIGLVLADTDEHGFYKSSFSLGNLKVEQSSKKIPTLYGDFTVEKSKPVSAPIWFPEERGIMIVSDIDDTLRDTGVADVASMIKNSLFLPYRPTRGLPTFLYTLKKYIDASHDSNSMFYYLSAGFIELSRDLQPFMTKYFPPGEIRLRKGMKSIWSLVSNKATFNYKTSILDLLHTQFPKKQLIVIGDSGEKDPEVYAEIYRRHPDWIKCILIRVVSGFNEAKESIQNTNERFDKTFEGIDSRAWKTFNGTEELNAYEIANSDYC